MMSSRVVLVAALSLLLAAPACPPSPSPPSPDSGDAAPPPPTDAGATVYDRACSAMADAGCKEGTEPNCAATLRHIAESRITPIDAERCAKAKSKADVRACGAVRCF